MIVVGGENLIDLIQTGAPADFRATPGGAPYNVAKALARQGVPTGYLTPVSDDHFGDLLCEGLQLAGAHCLSPRVSAPSSLAVVTLAGEMPAYRFYRTGTADRQVDRHSLSAHFPAGANAFYLGSLALAGGADADDWAGLFAQKHRDGVFTALDPNIRPLVMDGEPGYRDRLARVLRHTDLLKLSDEDLAWLYPGTAPDEAARRILDASAARVLVVTRGGDGATAFTPDIQVRAAAEPVTDMHDTVGAGDTFMAALLAYLAHAGQADATTLARMSPQEIGEMLRSAAAAAAINCARHGCNPPTRAEVLARLAQTGETR